MSDPRTHFSQAFFLALLVQNKPLNVLWVIFDHFSPFQDYYFLFYCESSLETKTRISVQFTWIGNDWLGMQRHWLPFKASHKRLSPHTPRILQLQFSFHILSAQTPKILLLQFSCPITHKSYSKTDELVSAILLVIFDPIAITPSVVHGIYQDLVPIYSTQDKFEFSALSTLCCHRPGCLDSHKAFFFLIWNKPKI